jgi:ankyrin repeat protein
VVAFLLERGARVNARDTSGRTALWFAALAADVHLARQLLAAGADAFIADAEGWSPLDIANELGERWMIRLFTAA